MTAVAVKVVSNAKEDRIVQEDGYLRVRVKAKAVGGSANRAVIALLADFFGVKEQDISIVRGARSREKMIRVTFSP